MKLLLTMNLPYLRSYGGTNRSNRSLAEALAVRGHEVRVVVPALGTPSSITYAEFLSDLTERNIRYISGPGYATFSLAGAEVIAVRDASCLRARLMDTITSYDPDWILVSSEDQSQSLLGAALSVRPRAVVYLAHTPQMFPFGPASLYPGEARTQLVRQTAAVVSISRFVASYVSQWTGCEVFVNHPPHYGTPPFADFGSIESEYVVLLNACAVKGISILTSLATAMPHIQFAAVPGWGTTKTDLSQIAKCPNVALLQNSRNLDEILEKTRLLLMPSLWVEGFGMAVVDAMLRGIPVLAGNLGGLPEAKLGTDFIFEVAPITQFSQSLDDALLPVPIVPTQHIHPWREAIEKLTADQALYRVHSSKARDVSNKFVASLSCAPLEKFLMELGDGRQPGNAHRWKHKDEAPPPGEGLTLQPIPKQIEQLTPEQRALFVLRWANRRKSEPRGGAKIAVIHGSRERLPLSFAQQRLWFLAHMEGGNEAYNIPVGVLLKGNLNRTILGRSLDRILVRHEILRTTFVVIDGDPVLRISPVENSSFLLIEHDLRKHDDARTELYNLYKMEASTAFDLEDGPLIRGRLIRLAEAEYALLLTMHHIVSDGWSMGVLVNELNILYTAFLRGHADSLPKLEIQYSDYAVWQRRRLEGEILQREASYWSAALAGAPPVLDLPTDHPRPAEQHYSGAHTKVVLDEELTARLRSLSRNHGTTLFMTLLAAWGILLSRLSGQEDVVIGTPIANRGRAEVENLIGLFVNTLAVRLDLSGSPTVGEMLDRVRTQVLAAQQHQDIPFERVVELAHPPRSMAHSPLFQTMFTWQNDNQTTLQLPQLGVEPLQPPYEVAKFDLTLSLEDTGTSIVGALVYATALFEPATIELYQRYFQNVLQAIVSDETSRVNCLSILSDSERRQLVQDSTMVRSDVASQKCVHEMFEAQVKKTPDSVAVVYKDQQLSYGELNRRANQLARYLVGEGTGPESIVGLALPRSLEMIIGLLGILKAGAAYLPLDPDDPREHLTSRAVDAQLHMLITGTRQEQRLPNQRIKIIRLDEEWESISKQGTDDIYSNAVPENLAYVIYTSGSTGKPKGAMITHYGLTNYLHWAIESYVIQGAGGAPLHSSLSYDLTVTSVFCPILSGQKIHIIPESSGFEGLARALQMSPDFSFCKVTPAHLDIQNSLLSAANADWGSRVIIIGGEALKYEAVGRPVNPFAGVRIINEYGPTEAVVGCCVYEVAEGVGDVPIGRAIANTRLYVLGGDLEPVPVASKGELYITGAGLARGYLRRPDLTAVCFVPNPFGVPGSRMYRTGDLGRWRKDAILEYLGRIDRQLKIRGFRVEPGEIEAVMGGHESVAHAVVLAREESTGEKQLVGYVVAASEERIDAAALRRYVAEQLPEYMVPAAIVVLPELPLSPNGKLDRRALPAPEFMSGEDRYRAPNTPEEEAMAGLFAEVLHLERVGIEDNFFELGGHSLLAARLMGRIRFTFNVDLPVRSIFEAPTVAALMERLQMDVGLIMSSDAEPRAAVSSSASAERRPWFIE